MDRRRRRRWIARALAGVALGAAVVLAVRPLAAWAKPGVVTARDGTPYTGDVTEDERYVYINAPGGRIQLDRRNVSKIDYAADVQTEYDARHAKLGAKDVKGRVELAKYASEHSRSDLALAALEEARQIDPANRDVALSTETVQRQMDLDRKRGQAGAVAAGVTKPGSATKPTAGATSKPATPAVAVVEHRLLNPAEINVIRQLEMRPDDPMVRVRLENNVARKFMLEAFGDATGKSAKRFMARSGAEQGSEILRDGSPEMAKDVRILTDPKPLAVFKTKVMPVIASSCASTACHGGVNGGSLYLYQGNSAAATYTNFYVLMTYAAQVNGVTYTLLDREVPDRSLALQFGLPPLIARPAPTRRSPTCGPGSRPRRPELHLGRRLAEPVAPHAPAAVRVQRLAVPGRGPEPGHAAGGRQRPARHDSADPAADRHDDPADARPRHAAAARRPPAGRRRCRTRREDPSGARLLGPLRSPMPRCCCSRS